MTAVSDRMRLLLARALGTRGADALGDLDEEFNERIRPTRSSLEAELWYVREGLSLLGAAVVDRWRERAARGGRTTTWGGEGMSSMTWVWRDAVRALVRAPGTSVVIVSTLAVALGATTTMFSLAHAAYLRPFPYPDAERVFQMYTGAQADPSQAFAVSPADLADVDAFSGFVEETAGWSVGESVHLTTEAQPERMNAPRVTDGFFPLLGAQPRLGRFFVPEEFEPGRDDAVVLSEALWIRAFGAEPSIIGRTVELDGRSVRIVGVAPAEGVVPREADMWRPLALGPEWYTEARWGWQFLNAMVRLSPEAAAGEPVSALNRRLVEVVPGRVERGGQTRVLQPITERRAEISGPAILLLLGAMVSVLALACVNIITVTMARAEGRMGEYGLRRALGSRSGPLAATALVEAGILALVGGGGGLLLAHRALASVERVDLEVLRGLGPLRIDLGVVAFAGGITMLTAAAMAIAPVLLAVRSEPRPVLAGSDARSGSSTGVRRLRDGLVTLQIAMATALLVSVGASAGGLRTLALQDPGFAPTGLVSMSVELPRDLAAGPEAPELTRRLIERIGDIPGVEGASAASFLPLEGTGWSASFDLVDPDPAVSELMPHANMRPIGPDYFETMGISIEEGRGFTGADAGDTAPVVVVDRSVADRYWPGASPIGERVDVGGLSPESAEIVGVAGNVPDERLGELGEGHVYFPLLQSPQRSVTVIARTAGDPVDFGASLRRAVAEVEPRMPVVEVVTMERRVADSYAGFRLGVLLLVGFGVVAATLAGIGVYGVLAYTVGRRAPELAMRMALGASPERVFRSVVGHSMRLCAVGATAGLLVSVLARGWLGRWATGVDLGSGPWMALAVLGVAVVCLVGAALPAGRAVRVDPVVSLRG